MRRETKYYPLGGNSNNSSRTRPRESERDWCCHARYAHLAETGSVRCGDIAVAATVILLFPDSGEHLPIAATVYITVADLRKARQQYKNRFFVTDGRMQVILRAQTAACDDSNNSDLFLEKWAFFLQGVDAILSAFLIFIFYFM